MRSTARRVPVLFTDLDGTIRHGVSEVGHHVHDPADVHVYDEVPWLLARYRALGWRIAAISNQGGVALGRVTTDAVEAVVRETERQCGAAFDSIAVCCHHPNAADPEDAVCWCRKPRSGLIFYATAHLLTQHPDEVYPPHLGLLTSDRPEDIMCAEGAALRFMVADEWRAGRHLAELVAARESDAERETWS